jgi:Xaa-Pro dipeptidase
MTRTFVLGTPADWQREIYELVHARAGGRPGRAAVGAEVRRSTRPPATSSRGAGTGEQFRHGLGHGVGLEIHEAPALSPLGAGTLCDRMAVTVEPGSTFPAAAASASRTPSSSREGAEPSC